MRSAFALRIISGKIIFNLQFWKICGFSRIAFSREGSGGYPLSHGLRRASSPKGTPLRYAASFSAAAKSRPLGEGGIAVGDDGRGNFRASSFAL